jgi:DNA-binding PucR family transcriptional regulator
LHASVKKEYVATLAHAVKMREHKFDGMLIGYVATLAHTQKLEKWKGSQSLLPKKTIPWRNQRKSLEVGAKLPVEAYNASITSSILEELPKCLWQS